VNGQGGQARTGEKPPVIEGGGTAVVCPTGCMLLYSPVMDIRFHVDPGADEPHI
jgi:hypothetical protein